MGDDSLHYPPGAEPEKPADEPKPEETPAEEKAPEPEAAKPEEKKPEEDKPAEKPEEGNEPPPEEPIKKRSIYDDYKEKKQEAKDATARAEAAEAKAAELQALLEKKDDAETPAEKKEAKDAIEAFAEREGLKPDSLRELTKIIVEQLPKQPSGLTEEEAAEWRADRAKAKAAAEDNAVLAEASGVKAQLAEFGSPVHDDAEFQKVMAEVVRLSHTKEFHDKSVDYIVYSKRKELAKLISPKKDSFEQGGQRGAEGSEQPIELSSKATPLDAQKAMQGSGRQEYDIRRST